MRLTKIKGIAHDLANHLDYQIWFGYYKKIPNQVSTDVIQDKDPFDRMCIEFFKERLPKSFDFRRIKSILVDIRHTMESLNIKVEVKVDSRTFTYSHRSLMS